MSLRFNSILITYIYYNYYIYIYIYEYINIYIYVHALYDHYNFIESNLERNNKLASLFLDLKKAFDLLDHKIPSNKLKYYLLGTVLIV